MIYLYFWRSLLNCFTPTATVARSLHTPIMPTKLGESVQGSHGILPSWGTPKEMDYETMERVIGTSFPEYLQGYELPLRETEICWILARIGASQGFQPLTEILMPQVIEQWLWNLGKGNIQRCIGSHKTEP